MSQDGGAESREQPAALSLLRWMILAAGLLLLILAPFLVIEDSISRTVGKLLSSANERPMLSMALVVGLISVDVFLPVPSSLVSVFAGAVFGWATGTVVIWVGMTLGGLGAYGLGFSAGYAVAVRIVGQDELRRASKLFQGAGPLGLVLTRGVPVLAEAGTLAAGAARMPFLRFLVWMSFGNLAVAAAYAGIGSRANSSSSLLLIFVACAALPAAGLAVWNRKTGSRRPVGSAVPQVSDRQRDVEPRSESSGDSLGTH